MEWYLQVVESVAVAVACLVVEVLFPSVLCEVGFELCTTYHVEVFFTGVTYAKSAVVAHKAVLSDGGLKIHAAEVSSSCDAYFEYAAWLLYLCVQNKGQQQGGYCG